MSDTSTSTTPEPTKTGVQYGKAVAQWQDADGLGIRLWVTHSPGEYRVRLVPVDAGGAGTAFDQHHAAEVTLPGEERDSRKRRDAVLAQCVVDLDALLPDVGPLRARWESIRGRVVAPGAVRVFL